MNLLDALLLVAAAWAVCTDFKSRRIPNVLTFGAAALALVLRLDLGGWPALQAGVIGWLAGIALLAVPFMLSWMGAGDVKLLAAFGAVGGSAFVLHTAVVAWIIGGAMALFCLAREGKLWFMLRHLFIFFTHPMSAPMESGRRMPFAPALALGAAASMLLTRVAL